MEAEAEAAAEALRLKGDDVDLNGLDKASPPLHPKYAVIDQGEPSSRAAAWAGEAARSARGTTARRSGRDAARGRRSC
jgi:hypothetical protein